MQKRRNETSIDPENETETEEFLVMEQNCRTERNTMHFKADSRLQLYE